MDNHGLQAEDVKGLLLKVYRDLKLGNITEDQASKETFILSNILKAIQVTDMEARLIKIEEAIKS